MDNTSLTQEWRHEAERAVLLELSEVGHSALAVWDAVVGWAWTPLLAFIVVVIAAISGISYEHRRWNSGWLSELIAERLSVIRRRRPSRRRALPKGWRRLGAELRLRILESWDRLLTYFKSRFINDLKALYFPSPVSFAIFAITIAAFFFVPRFPPFSVLHWQNWWEALTTDLSSERPRPEGLIIGAFTGLTVVVIALIVFVAESIRDDKDYERKRALVRKSFLWPLGIAATLIPFGFLWSTSRGLTIVLEVIVAGVTLYSFARVVRALFDPEVRASDRLRLLSDRVHGVVFDSAKERIGNSILLEQLGPGKRIDTFNYLISRVWIENEPHHFIDAPRDGWVSDIQLEELQKLGDRLDRYAQEHLGFVLRQSGPDVQAATSGGGPTVSAARPLPEKKAYLLKRYREEIPPDSIFYANSRSIFALPEAFAQSQAVLDDIDASIPHIFRFEKKEPSSTAMRREMQGTKDQLAQAIRDHALGEIEELRQTYLQIAEEFLKLLFELGGGYTAEQAEKERGNYFESWSEIRWLLTDLRELIIIAADAGNTDVLGRIAFLPFLISMRAIQARDHYLFQQFFQFASFLYFLAIEKPQGLPVRTWLIDKSWRWPKEIADFYIARELELRTNTPGEIEQMRDFALYSLRVYQDLMKSMADNKDIAAFTNTLRTFRDLYERFREAGDQPSVALLQFQLERAENQDQRATLSAQLERMRKRRDVARALNVAIDEIFIALGGRVLAQYLAAPGSADVKSLLDAIMASLPDTVERLAASFAEASDWRASDKWGWSQWDMIPDGKAHWVDSHTKLNQIFVVRALNLLANLSPDARKNIQLPSSHALAEMARDNNAQGLQPSLNAIEADPQRWEGVLNEGARDCVGCLRELLSAARTAEQEREAEYTKQAPLNPAKVEEFRNELVRSFLETARLRRILMIKNAFEVDLTKSPGPPVQSLGFNQIDDKNAFIDQERISYAGWGRGYGQGLAHGEDEEAFAIMIQSAKARATITPNTVVESIGKVVAEGKLKDLIVLQTLEFDVQYHQIERNPSFTPKYSPDLQSPWNDFNGFMGVLTIEGRRIPVFNTFVRRPESQNHILVLDAAHFLRWRQFAPDHEPDEQTYGEGQLQIRVVDLNADANRRNEIIAQNPAWLSGEADPGGYLRGRVVIYVFEKFQIEILDAGEAVCLTVPQ